jgi:hypothetical protein
MYVIIEQYSINALLFSGAAECTIDEYTPVRRYNSGTPVSFAQFRKIALTYDQSTT